MEGNSFDPATAGAGTWDVVYMYTDSNGCSVSDSSQITVDLCLGIAQGNSNGVEVYPNPSNGQFTVTAPVSSHIVIYSALGERVMEFVSATDVTPIDMRDFATGVYYIRVNGENISFGGKLILK